MNTELPPFSGDDRHEPMRMFNSTWRPEMIEGQFDDQGNVRLPMEFVPPKDLVFGLAEAEMTAEERAALVLNIHGLTSAQKDSFYLPVDLNERIVAAITAAVLEERERCAKVAEAAARNYDLLAQFPPGQACRRVAAVIREGGCWWRPLEQEAEDDDR